MKIAFIYAKQTSEYKRSPETGSKRMAKLLPSSIAMSDDEVDYNELREKGYTIFCYNHNPTLFKHRKLVVGCQNDIVNTRDMWISRAIGIKCQSGFSYIKSHLGYDCYFPTISTYKRTNVPSDLCIGYYARSVRYDTDRRFVDFVNRLPLDVPIVIMGDKLNLKRDCIYTDSEDYFFSLCTHYFYGKSLVQVDPYPHTLMQACQVGCSIIMPDIKRDWKDGIDDILDVCDVNVLSENEWDKISPCRFAPSGEDFVPLYELISQTWHWLPPSNMKTFSDLYNFTLSL